MTDGTLNDGGEDNLLISPAWFNNGSQSGDLGCKTVYYIIHLGHVFGKILSLFCHHVLDFIQCLGEQPKYDAGVTAGRRRGGGGCPHGEGPSLPGRCN